MDCACWSAASIHQTINPSGTPTNAPSVAPIQSLHPSIASPHILAITGPSLSLPTFDVSTIPPVDDHPSDPVGADDSSVDTESNIDHQNFGQAGFGPL